MSEVQMSDTESRDTVINKLDIYGASSEDRYVLRLYVSGTTPQSTQAILNIKRICEVHLKDRYDLEVIDLYQQPGMTRTEQIFAVPTLIKSFPLPLRKLIGNLSDIERVLAALELPGKGETVGA
jgi:circadian clock protein KaiB